MPDGSADPVPVQRRHGVKRDAKVLRENAGVEWGVPVQSHLRTDSCGHRLTLALEPSLHSPLRSRHCRNWSYAARMIVSNACTPFASRLGSLRR